MPRATPFLRAHVALSYPPSPSRTQLCSPGVIVLPFGSKGQGIVDASLTSGRRTWLLAAVLLLGSAACGGDDDSAATTTTRAQESTTSTSEASDEEAAVLDAYEAFWDAYLEAADPMDPQHPVLQDRKSTRLNSSH